MLWSHSLPDPSIRCTNTASFSSFSLAVSGSILFKASWASLHSGLCPILNTKMIYSGSSSVISQSVQDTLVLYHPIFWMPIQVPSSAGACAMRTSWSRVCSDAGWDMALVRCRILLLKLRFRSCGVLSACSPFAQFYCAWSPRRTFHQNRGIRCLWFWV